MNPEETPAEGLASGISAPRSAAPPPIAGPAVPYGGPVYGAQQDVPEKRSGASRLVSAAGWGLRLLLAVAVVYGGSLAYGVFFGPPVQVVGVTFRGDAQVASEGIRRTGVMESDSELAFGGERVLVLTRDNPNGRWVAVRARVTQNFLLQHKSNGKYDLYLRGADVRLGEAPASGIAEQDRPPTMPLALSQVQPSGVSVAWKKGSGIVEASGTERVVAYGMRYERSLSRSGMSLTWDGQMTCWLAGPEDSRPQFNLGFSRWDVDILFPLPQGATGKVPLYFQGKKVAAVDLSAPLIPMPGTGLERADGRGMKWLPWRAGRRALRKVPGAE